jgi:hypothetical protein
MKIECLKNTDFFSDSKKIDSDEQNQTNEDDHSEELQASDENNLIVPLEAWQNCTKSTR